jgi:hypothetical protein
MALLDRDAAVSAQTLYFDIDLGPAAAGAERKTAVFFPVGYVPRATPDVLVYLFGFGAPPIDAYLADPRFPLREETNAAGEAKTSNLIMIAPTLGQRAEAGDLVDKGLCWFLGEVLSSLVAGAPALVAGSAGPSFGKVYVAAHSGGGARARALAMKGEPVDEYWLFDALYAPSPWGPTDKTDPANVRPLGHPDAVEEEWLDVLQKQPVKLYCYYATGEPTQRSKNLEAFVTSAAGALQGQAVFVHSSSSTHDGVPQAHWKDRVNGRS